MTKTAQARSRVGGSGLVAIAISAVLVVFAIATAHSNTGGSTSSKPTAQTSSLGSRKEAEFRVTIILMRPISRQFVNRTITYTINGTTRPYVITADDFVAGQGYQLQWSQTEEYTVHQTLLLYFDLSQASYDVRSAMSTFTCSIGTRSFSPRNPQFRLIANFYGPKDNKRSSFICNLAVKV